MTPLHPPTQTGLLIFLIAFLVYLLSSLPVLFKDTFHHYTYLAQAFWEGKFNLRLPLPGVHRYPDSFDDIAVYRDKFYLGLPPAPAFFLLPFIPWQGVNTNARLITVILGAINVWLAYRLMWRSGCSFSKSIWLAALFSLGSVHWFVASHGGAWYLAQICAVFFLLSALLTASRGGSPLGTGILLGGAFLSRQLTILTFPYFLYLIASHRPSAEGEQKLPWKGWLLFAVGLSLGIGAYFAYNYLRFGDILQTGYAYHKIRGAAILQYQRYGLFHPHYLPRNIYTVLFLSPRLIENFPYFIPTVQGQALIFTTPALFYVFKARGSRAWLTSLWLSILLIFSLQLLYCNNGSWQFGYRFLLDFLPLLLILISRGTPDPLTPAAASVFILSALLNLHGVILLRNLL